jgi:hypothetical protein
MVVLGSLLGLVGQAVSERYSFVRMNVVNASTWQCSLEVEMAELFYPQELQPHDFNGLLALCCQRSLWHL